MFNPTCSQMISDMERRMVEKVSRDAWMHTSRRPNGMDVRPALRSLKDGLDHISQRNWKT